MKNLGIQLIDNLDQGNVLDIKINPERNASGKIVKGLVIGQTLEQNKALLLMAQQGEFKNTPFLGIGLKDILLGQSTDLLEYRHKIRRQFPVDGLNISKLQLYPNKPFIIEATYE